MVSESTGTTWIVISWDVPLQYGDIFSYIVAAFSDNGSVYITVDGRTTEVNMTGLEPGTEYTLRVEYFSLTGGISSPSDPLIVTTLARPGKQVYFIAHVAILVLPRL